MPSSPLVSLVIPNYNYAAYVAEAIQSAFSQTYTPIEIIVVDDGSTDNSVEVIKKFEPNIRLLQQSNSGVVVARNRGLSEAKGEFVSFLDADDRLKPKFISTLIQPLLQNPSCGLSFSDYETFDQQQVVITANSWNPKKLLYRNYIIPSALVRRTALDQVGGYSLANNTTANFEDWDLWLKLVEAGWSGAYVPEVLFEYRLHGQGRNVAGLAHRKTIEQQLEQAHPGLYRPLSAKVYLLWWRNLSRLRNTIIKAPGT